ncbi:hypothetical protein J6X90_00975 [Candidatus Saccharibacteria bacterium]|nr:hypothetical protein [Candidatus Saccharibacteria bacterium]
MKKIPENFKKIFENHKALLLAQVFLLVISIALFIFTLLNLGSNTTVVKTSYGDIGRYQGGEWSSMANSGGYHDDTWTERFAYPLLAIVFGILHNLIAIKIFEKKGSGAAGYFVLFSVALVFATFVVFTRLLAEG